MELKTQDEEALATIIVGGKKVVGPIEASSAFASLAETSPYLRLLASMPVETVHPRDLTGTVVCALNFLTASP